MVEQMLVFPNHFFLFLNKAFVHLIVAVENKYLIVMKLKLNLQRFTTAIKIFKKYVLKQNL
jgi:hypothetical protein